MMYMEEKVDNLTVIGMDYDDEKTRDVNDVELKKTDDVTIIKDLLIKGSPQIIKQGTVVSALQTIQK